MSRKEELSRQAARLFAALDCDVSYWTRRRRAPEKEQGARYRELDDLIATSDFLVVTIALAETTRGLLDATRLARMPRGGYLINAARGGIVDQRALVAALSSGALAGAALDVFETEPLPAGDPLRDTDRVLLSPHTSGTTPGATHRLIKAVMTNVQAAMEGRPVVHVVNGVSPVVVRR